MKSENKESASMRTLTQKEITAVSGGICLWSVGAIIGTLLVPVINDKILKNKYPN